MTTVKNIALLLPLFALAACSSEPANDSAAAPAATPTVTTTPSLSPPRREEFTAAWAKACPEAKPVSTALCKSKGLGDPNFTCEFGVGEDEYRRNTAELTAGEGEWILVNAPAACEAE